MERHDLAELAQFIGRVAQEAVDESDAIERHPEIVDLLIQLSELPEVHELFGGNGHDPSSFMRALAEGLAPYRAAPLEDAPQLIEGLALVSQALRHEVREPIA
ncbi:MAG: hypothetical protein QOD71_3444 [Thermoleophilaceae bacterium]|jgi:hypothetical protein|nr:hypothetical protein [Thermoleophilaceae bacterium]